MSLESLPDEIIFEIMDRMILKDCLALECVNKSMRERLYEKNDKIIWGLNGFMYRMCYDCLNIYTCKHSENCCFKMKCNYDCEYGSEYSKDSHKFCKFGCLSLRKNEINIYTCLYSKQQFKKCNSNCKYNCEHGKDCHKLCEFSCLHMSKDERCEACVSEDMGVSGYNFLAWRRLYCRPSIIKNRHKYIVYSINNW